MYLHCKFTSYINVIQYILFIQNLFYSLKPCSPLFFASPKRYIVRVKKDTLLKTIFLPPREKEWNVACHMPPLSPSAAIKHRFRSSRKNNIKIQWKPLNVIMVNVISRLLWSDFIVPIYCTQVGRCRSSDQLKSHFRCSEKNGLP